MSRRSPLWIPRFWWHIRSLIAILPVLITPAVAQNSMIGDGFGGRLWYRPTNYTVGSYSAFSLCYSDPCDSSSNQLYGWGGDNVDELGNGPGATCSNVPVPIPGMADVRYFSTGYWMSVIKNDGTGWVWGGIGGGSAPVQVITDVSFVDASSRGSSFIKTDGTVWSIGSNEFGQFGDGTLASNTTAPVQMTGVSEAVRVAVGLFSSYVLLADSTLLVLGSSWNGLLGDPSLPDTVTTPTPIPGLTRIIDVKTTTYSATALDADGNLYTWGHGGYTGDGDQLNDTLPRLVQGLSNIVAISGCTDGNHFLALDAEMNAYVYGNYNLSAAYPSPTLIATDVIDIMAGETFSYIVKSDGSLWAAGSSLCGSVWLDQPNFLHPAAQMVLTQLDPSAVPGSCPLLGTIAIPTATCTSGTVTIYHFGGPAPYLYDIGTGSQSSNVFIDVPLGQYTISVTDASGCVTTVPCTVAPDGSAPVVLDMGNVLSCIDEGYTFPSGTTTYDPGSHSDTTFSVLGCDTVRLYQVVLTPLPMLTQLVHLCEGDPYTLPNGDVAYAPSYHFVDTLLYADACDTIFNISLVLSNLPPIVAEVATADSTITSGESVLLSPSPGSSYSWSPSTGLSCIDCTFPLASPVVTTEYCVVVSGNASGGIGCGSDTACLTITVVEPSSTPCAAENIFVPTAFSPDASGMNDQQCVQGSQCIGSMTFSIYDRWGNKVFESTDPKACWDGTHKGQPLDPAVFVYHLSATMINGETFERQGNITLVR